MLDFARISALKLPSQARAGRKRLQRDRAVSRIRREPESLDPFDGL